MKHLLAAIAVTPVFLFGACNDSTRDARAGTSTEATLPMIATENTINDVLAAQPAETQARYAARNPGETLGFVGIKPGMTVVDVLPGAKGEGWYTPILAGVLGANGADGKLIGVDYSLDMWPEFGGFADAEFIEEKKTWGEDWIAGAKTRQAAGDFGDVEVDFAATTFGADIGDLAGQADAVLFMRAMHNVSRFEEAGGYMIQAVSDAYQMLKPGGVVGVVQHRAPESQPDDWAVGSNGYVKQSRVINAFEAGGFELLKSSEINANPKDVPSAEAGDMVWRLPPTLGTSRDNADLKAEMEAIGESDRMTLVFRKPL